MSVSVLIKPMFLNVAVRQFCFFCYAIDKTETGVGGGNGGGRWRKSERKNQYLQYAFLTSDVLLVIRKDDYEYLKNYINCVTLQEYVEKVKKTNAMIFYYTTGIRKESKDYLYNDNVSHYRNMQRE